MKNKQSLSLVFLLFVTSFLAHSQDSGDFIKANKAFKNYEYGKAEEIFKKAYERSNDRAEKNEISYKLAQCYFYLGNYKKAESNFRRTIKMRYKNPKVHFYLAECYKAMEKFDKAEEEYMVFIQKDPSNDIGLIALESLNLSREWTLEGSKYRVVNAGDVLNSEADDFSPYFGDKKQSVMYFSSSREGVLGKKINQQTGQLFSDIFVVGKEKLQKKGKSRAKKNKKEITPPKWFNEWKDGENSTEKEHNNFKDIINFKNSEEGVITLDKRYKKMLFTRALFEKHKYQGRRIYSAEWSSGKWSDVLMEVIPVDDTVDVHGPAFGADEKTLFFSAEIAGGYGGTDLYMTQYDRRKKSWGDPVNLGSNINSEGNEGFPYYSVSTNNLYFSSNGRAGMGGLDIYVATSDVEKYSFNMAENLKYPINTCYDDFGIIFEKSNGDLEPELKGYFSSNRTGNKWDSKGNTDIYYFDKQQIFFRIDGKVIDVADGSPMSGVTVELIGPTSSKIANTDGNGCFSIPTDAFKEGEDYRLVVNKEWFFQQVDTTITTKNITHKECCVIGYKCLGHDDPLYPDDDRACKKEENLYGNLFYNIYRGPIEMKTMRRPLVLKSVLFDLGKSNLRLEGKEELDSLASLLTKDWPNVVIELRSHTDLRGSDTLNARLSLDRAQSCVDYLVEQGVSSDRLIAVGMTDTEPVIIEDALEGLPLGVIDLEYINKLSSKRLREKAHQINRRTDFKVLSNDVETWIKDNPKLISQPIIKDASIDKDGNIKPNTKGNFVGEY